MTNHIPEKPTTWAEMSAASMLEEAFTCSGKAGPRQASRSKGSGPGRPVWIRYGGYDDENDDRQYRESHK